MLNYLQSHLTAKIFLITAAMLLIAASVTYGFISLYAPGRYLIAVEEAISREAEELVDKIGQEDKEDAEEMLEQFSSLHSITVTLKTAKEEGVSTERADEESVFAESGAVAVAPASVLEEYHISMKEPKAIYEFQYKDSPEKYTLSIDGINQAATPLTTALNQALFPLMAVVFILALIVSAFYSRYITRPVIQISEASKKMASLDFDIFCDETRNDELGVLSGNLNELSRCLSAAMEDLNHANTMLKEDVEREKELEGQQLAFFSAVSHELKTPITVLKGQLQGMLYGVGGYKDRDKYLKRAFEVTCSMENLVMEILTVSRMKSSGFSLQMEEIQLTDFVAGILENHEELLLEKGLNVVMEADSSNPPAIQADKRLFTKVISNLISNACHYSPSGEEIRIQISKVDGAVQLSIENTGVHIPEEEIPGLFEPFTRREQSRNRETGGSGLGLFIVRMVLELHHFSYGMENTEDSIRFSTALTE